MTHLLPHSPWPTGRRVPLGAALFLARVVIAPPWLLSIPDASAEMIAHDGEILTRVSHAAEVLFRAKGFAFAPPVFLIVQRTTAPGWCRPGQAAVKAGMIDNAAHPLRRRGTHLIRGAPMAGHWRPDSAGCGK